MKNDTMRAIQIRQPGGPEAMELVDLPMPRPGPGDVLIRTRYIGVGMPDVLIRSGRYPWMPSLPAVLGIELTGIIEEVGDAVKKLLPGQPVFLSARDLPQRAGCYAEFVAAPAQAVTPLEPGIDLQAAAALSNYQVAWHLVNTAARGVEVKSMLVIASAGGVGSAAVQLARLKGWTVIGVDSAPPKEAFARAQGVHHWINYRTEDVTQAVGRLTQGRGVDLVLDPVGGPDFNENFRRIARFGMVVNYGMLQGPPANALLEGMRQNYETSPALRMFTMHSFDADPDVRRHTMAELQQLLGRSLIRPPIDSVMPLELARAAHQRFESGAVLGKLLLQP